MEYRSLAPDLIVSTDGNSGGDQLTGEPTSNVAQDELFKEKQMGRAVNCNDLELSTYLRALAEGYLPTFYSDTSQSVQSKSMSIASKSFRRGKRTVVFHGFPSLKMSKCLTENRGEGLLMWYREDFLVKTSVQPEEALGLTESGAECGEKWRGSFTRYDPDTSSWRTHQCSLLGGLDEFSETWPQWGLMRAGECWERQTLAQTIKGTGFGLSPDGITTFHTPCTTGLDGGSNSRRALKKRMEKWPTPQASDHRDRGNMGNPCVQRRIAIGKQISLSQSVSPTSGQLNPTWVEWLMGWPLGWTDLKPLGTDKFHFVQP